MMQYSSESSQIFELSEKARVCSPPPCEAKTAEKTKSKTLTKMRNLETVFEKIAIVEIEARISTITTKKNQRNQQLEERSIVSIAHFQLILQDNPHIVDNAINFLVHLSNKLQLPVSLKRMFSIEKLKDQFTRRSPRSENLFRKSITMLHNEIKYLLSSYRNPQQGINTQFDVKLEIFAQFMKRYKDFHEYLPKENNVVRKIQLLNLLVSRKQLRKIKYFYSKCSDKIAFLGKHINIIDLVDTYFLLLLKRKFCIAKAEAKLKLDNRSEQLIQEKMAVLKKNKQLHEQNSMKNEGMNEKYPFSELYKNFCKHQRQQYCKTSPEKLIQMAKLFEQMIKETIELTLKHPVIVSLSKQRKISTTNILKKYKTFQKYRQIHQRWYGEDLSSLKRALIARYLKRNPQFTYEQILVKVFNRTSVYIEKDFFQENIVSILQKENQFQQFFYLNQVMKGIEKQRSAGTQVVFIDYRDVEIEGQEESPFSMIAAVTLGGTIICKMYDAKMTEQLFLQEIATIFQKATRQSVLVLFDRNFPFSNLLKQNEIASLRSLHFLISLPSISVVPNPSQQLCKNIQSQIKAQCRKLEKNEQTITTIFEKAVELYSNKEILAGIVSKQWQKSKIFQIECQHFDDQSYKTTNFYDNTPVKTYFAQISGHQMQNKLLKEKKETEGNEKMEVQHQQLRYDGLEERFRRNDAQAEKGCNKVQRRLFKEEKAVKSSDDEEVDSQGQLSQEGFEEERVQRSHEIVGRNKVQRKLFKEEKVVEQRKNKGMEQQSFQSSDSQQLAQDQSEEMINSRQQSHLSEESECKIPLMENLAHLNQEQYLKLLPLLSRLVNKLPFNKKKLRKVFYDNQ